MKNTCRSILMISMLCVPAHGIEPRDPLPTLDELLGLDAQSDQGDRVIEDPNDAALDQMLDPQQAGEALVQAVTLMDQVATRIAENHDLSITTQRLQEDILSMLDQVIESAQNSDSQGGGGSSSSSKSSSSNQNQPNQQQQSQQPGEGSQPSSQSGESMPGGTSQANPGDEIAPDGAGWGALPQRIRDALSQGISDQYSELYRSITEQYYKSLAEDED